MLSANCPTSFCKVMKGLSVTVLWPQVDVDQTRPEFPMPQFREGT